MRKINTARQLLSWKADGAPRNLEAALTLRISCPTLSSEPSSACEMPAAVPGLWRVQ